MKFKELFESTVLLPTIGKKLKIDEIQKAHTDSKSTSGRYPEKVTDLLILSDDDNKYYFNSNGWWIISKKDHKRQNKDYSDLTKDDKKIIWKLWGKTYR
jgi:hypothetical protein